MTKAIAKIQVRRRRKHVLTLGVHRSPRIHLLIRDVLNARVKVYEPQRTSEMKARSLRWAPCSNSIEPMLCEFSSRQTFASCKEVLGLPKTCHQKTFLQQVIGKPRLLFSIVYYFLLQSSSAISCSTKSFSIFVSVGSDGARSKRERDGARTACTNNHYWRDNLHVSGRVYRSSACLTDSPTQAGLARWACTDSRFRTQLPSTKRGF